MSNDVFAVDRVTMDLIPQDAGAESAHPGQLEALLESHGGH